MTFQRQPRHAPNKMTTDYGRTMALDKARRAPLRILTDAMIVSISVSGASAHSRPKLLAELRAIVAERRAREAGQ